MIRLWRRYQRWFDVKILWPSCKKAAEGDRALAEHVFRMHMAIDNAYADMDEPARTLFVRSLPD